MNNLIPATDHKPRQPCDWSEIVPGEGWRTMPMRDIDLPGGTIAVGSKALGHVVKIRYEAPLANASEDIFKLLEGLGVDECLVLQREPLRLSVFERKQALLLDAQEVCIIDRPRGAAVG